jgi:hypothetical protein
LCELDEFAGCDGPTNAATRSFPGAPAADHAGADVFAPGPGPTPAEHDLLARTRMLDDGCMQETMIEVCDGYCEYGMGCAPPP